MELATPLSNDGDRVDAYHDGEPLRYRTMDNILGDQPVPEMVVHDFEVELHLAHEDAAWRAAMQQEMDAVEQNRTWELVDLPAGPAPSPLSGFTSSRRMRPGR
jgi:hypothetical protein